MRIVVETVFGLYLILMSILDYRSKSIPLAVLICGAIFVPFFILTDSAPDIYRNILGILPGALFVLISLVSHGQVGMADAAVLMIMGACTGIGQIIGILAAALLTIAVFSMVMLLARKLTRKSTLPFIPFLFLGYLIIVFVL